jgi:hypothetical protein
MYVKIKDKDFHRNGVSGEPFYLVDFTLYEEDEDEIGLMAVITEKEVYVIDPENIYNKFRGDMIGEQLRNKEEMEDLFD